MDHDYICFFLIKNNELNSFILMVGVAEWCWFHFRVGIWNRSSWHPLYLLLVTKTALQGGFSKVL